MFRCPSRKIQFLSALVVLMVLVCPLSALAAEVNGVVQSGDPPDETPIAFSTVTLFKAGRHGRGARVLGRAQSDSNGQFTIVYKPPAGSDAVLYLIADGERESSWGRRFRSRKSPVRLATILGTAPFPDEVTINERTTVATAYAMAQFIQGRHIGGKFPGLQNAADILRNNLVDVDTGEAAAFFNTSPNTPEETSTLATFNSLANMLAACVQTPSNCMTLFQEATTPRGRTPRNTLQAMVNIAHNPGQNVPELFNLSQAQPTYQPALPSDAISTGVVNAWILAISYNAQDMDGPGNIAFDSLGNAWVNNNYEFSLSLDPDPPVCGSTKVIKLTPTGGSAPGAPFGGMDGPNSGVNAGGLYGAGFGITLDPDENVWISSFGFQGSGCLNDLTALYVSVAKFGPDGTTLSTPDGDPANNVPGGFTNDPLMAAPQGIVSDRKGNIWIANCTGPDATLPPAPHTPGSVTLFPRGNPDKAKNISPIDPDTGEKLFNKPFDIAIDKRGHAWVADNGASIVVELGEDGARIGEPVTNTDGIELPMGIASDGQGNLWVANAGIPNPPCPPANFPDPSAEIDPDGSLNFRASVTLIKPRGKRGRNRQVTTYKRDGGKRDGLRWPWGISVDGADNVWIANFAGQRLMQLCGVKKENCLPGASTGDPISPNEGYFSDALQRVTAVEIDPSGNVWATNNWVLEGFNNKTNPGGHEVVVFIGLAAPIKTPLIGPPQQLR